MTLSIQRFCDSVPQVNSIATDYARTRQNQLTKPTGSLGRIEDLCVQIAGITGFGIPDVNPPAIFIFAADHGVAHSHQVSAYPPEVTPHMVLNFVNGGAVINALGRQIGGKVIVTDIGVNAELPALMSIRHCKVRYGTRDWTVEAAMTYDEMDQALLVGAETATLTNFSNPYRLACIGEMGIGNTTTASALACAILGKEPELLVGRGTGLDDAGWLRKIEVVKSGLALHQETVDSSDVLAILRVLGGLEIAGMAGAMIGAASLRIPVVIDGFISSVAALVACSLVPALPPFLIASHRSDELGHSLVLESLGLTPILDLGMRLGEASGAALATTIIQSAVRIHSETATFEEANVPDRE